MSNELKVCVVTSTRADYGILFWLMKAIEASSKLNLQIIATGMHLSSEFGLTYKEIEKDFDINEKVEILLSSDTPVGVSKSMGLSQIGYAEAFDRLKPDVTILLGDRYEIFCAASVATIAQIPIIHLHGGETTEGAVDEVFRHSITKMSHLHFTATEKYKNRVIQLGEKPETVYNFGAMGIENINRLKLLNKSEFEASIDFKLKERNILITFHSVTLEKETSERQFRDLLNALDGLTDTKFIFTKANSDTNGRVINRMIDSYVSENQDKAISFTSLGQLRYLSALQFMTCVVGNSSSGLIEVPSFKIPTVNIGNRQKGREKARSVIDCLPEEYEIRSAIEKAHSISFKNDIADIKNPYGQGNVSDKIVDVIEQTDFSNILMKTFHEYLNNTN